MKFGIPRRRVLACISIAAAGALGLSACGSGGGSDSASGKIEGTITFQTWNLKAGYSKYFKGLIKDFEKAHPGAHVKWQDQPADNYDKKVQSQATNHDMPDVLNTTPDLAYPLAKAGVLMNVSDEDPDAKKLYLPGSWKSLTYKDPKGVFAYPWYLNTGPNFFDKKLFKKAGLDPENPPVSYDEMLADAVTLGKNVKGKYYLWGNVPSINDIALWGAPLMNKDETKFTFNTDEAAAMVDKYRKAYKAGGFLPAGLNMKYTGVGKAFMSGKVAMNSGSAYDLQNFKKNAPTLAKHLGIGPAFTNTGKYEMSVQSISVASQSDHLATAKAFARFVTNEKNQMAFAKLVNIFPSTAGTLDKPFFRKLDGTKNTELRVKAAKQLKSAVEYTPIKFTPEMATYLQQQLSDAILGKEPSKQALDKTVAKANSLLAQG
ncbi:ABC transporter substrate-binding protein [Spelaeicoccus albus]|uniref:Multiple sugar transport system substrate-binding protein n=1 Tax=Spelaeicoccus albus TaxID=1280376 RepID=A0A7Z0A976_9MICO|nr:sugar ABC transporter substrate-binding protein [Spelaeicoccus albus]NYI66727.1 multiple sugar transport system substrate-binding protein [Spelaeicoccus albus]